MSSEMMRKLFVLCLLAAVVPAAHAHPFHAEASGFPAGLAHPLGGLDHLLAMLAVGLWSAWAVPQQKFVLPLAFLTAMAGGATLALSGLTLPFVEPGIGVSVLVLGLLLAGLVRLPLAAGAGLISVFALFHGLAHGAGLPEAASPYGYAAGFLLATGLLHLAGIAIGTRLAQQRTWWLRAIGTAMGLSGLWLLAGA